MQYGLGELQIMEIQVPNMQIPTKKNIHKIYKLKEIQQQIFMPKNIENKKLERTVLIFTLRAITDHILREHLNKK